MSKLTQTNFAKSKRAFTQKLFEISKEFSFFVTAFQFSMYQYNLKIFSLKKVSLTDTIKMKLYVGKSRIFMWKFSYSLTRLATIVHVIYILSQWKFEQKKNIREIFLLCESSKEKIKNFFLFMCWVLCHNVKILSKSPNNRKLNCIAVMKNAIKNLVPSEIH